MEKIRGSTKRENDVLVYFYYCPLCLETESMNFEWGSSGDYMTCAKCKARWHLNYGITGFHWAELIKGDSTGKNQGELLNVRHKPDFWILMAIEGLKSKASMISLMPDKSGEVVKVRCPYCGKLYDKSMDNCPYCGGYR